MLTSTRNHSENVRRLLSLERGELLHHWRIAVSRIGGGFHDEVHGMQDSVEEHGKQGH